MTIPKRILPFGGPVVLLTERRRADPAREFTQL